MVNYAERAKPEETTVEAAAILTCKSFVDLGIGAKD